MILYNVWNFIEIVLTNGADDAQKTLEKDGYKSKILIGVNGREYPIDITDDEILESDVMGHLTALGMNDLIPSMCPNLLKKPNNNES